MLKDEQPKKSRSLRAPFLYHQFLPIRPTHTHTNTCVCVCKEFFSSLLKKRRHGRKGWPGVTDRSRGIKSRSGPTDITRRVMEVVWYDCFFFLFLSFFFFLWLWLVLLEAKLFFSLSERSTDHLLLSRSLGTSSFLLIWRAGEKGRIFYFFFERSRTSDDLRGTRMKHTAPPVDNARAPVLNYSVVALRGIFLSFSSIIFFFVYCFDYSQMG